MNEEKFTGKADNYDRFRPSYPAGLIDRLYEKTGAETVADIGAGTGIFTKCLSAKPWKIIAVEPNADMLEKLKMNVPDAEIIAASAENTGIAERSVGLVTAAQAFHWFDRERFKAECMRILAPNGRLAIIWSNRGECEMQSERNEIFLRNTGQYDSVKGNANAGVFEAGEYFAEYEQMTFTQSIKLDMEQYVGYEMSMSYAPRKGTPVYERHYEELRRLFEKYARDGVVEALYKPICYLGKF